MVGLRRVETRRGDKPRLPACGQPDQRLPVRRQEDRDDLTRRRGQVVLDQVRSLGHPVVEADPGQLDSLSGRVVVERNERAGRVSTVSSEQIAQGLGHRSSVLLARLARLAAWAICPAPKVSCVATREGGMSMESVVARTDPQVPALPVAESTPGAERDRTGVRRRHVWGVGLLAAAAATLYFAIGALAYARYTLGSYDMV